MERSVKRQTASAAALDGNPRSHLNKTSWVLFNLLSIAFVNVIEVHPWDVEHFRQVSANVWEKLAAMEF